jgi:hypothetical protein
MENLADLFVVREEDGGSVGVVDSNVGGSIRDLPCHRGGARDRAMCERGAGCEVGRGGLCSLRQEKVPLQLRTIAQC